MVAGTVRRVSVGALVNTVVMLNHSMYAALSVLLALAFTAIVVGGSIAGGLTYVGLNASPYWLLTGLINMVSPEPFALTIVSFLVAASVLPFTTLHVRESALLLAQAPLSRGRFLATAYLMAASLGAAPAVISLLVWSLVIPNIVPYASVGPAALGGAAAAVTALYTIPSAVFAVSLAAIASSRLRFTHTAALIFALAYLIIGPFLLAAATGWVGHKLFYAAAALCPGTGLAYYASVASGLFIRSATEKALEANGIAFAGLNPATCLAVSLASLAVTAAAAALLFTRYAEVRGA